MGQVKADLVNRSSKGVRASYAEKKHSGGGNELGFQLKQKQLVFDYPKKLLSLKLF